MDKKEKTEMALSKLTIEEQELLGLTKMSEATRVRENYKLKIFYEIGDCNGNTDRESVISINNPFLKPLIEALSKLDGSGEVLDKGFYESIKKIGNINDFEYELLSLVTDYFYKEDANAFFEKHGYSKSKKNHNYLQEIEGLLISDTEYSYLVYVGYELK